jgi:hypothetical protein
MLNMRYDGGYIDFSNYEVRGDLDGIVEVQFDEQVDGIFAFNGIILFESREDWNEDDPDGWHNITADNPLYNTIKERAINDYNDLK